MLCLKSTPGGRKWFRLCKGIYGNIPSTSRLIYLAAKGTSDTQQHYDSFVLFIQGRSRIQRFWTFSGADPEFFVHFF